MGDWDLSPNVWKAVLDELLECSLFRGIHDAKTGNESFMYGICTVIEYIASHASEDEYEKFSNMFTQNMIISKESAE